MIHVDIGAAKSPNHLETVASHVVTDSESVPDLLTTAKQTVAEDRQRRVDAFLADLEELAAKHQVQLRVKPVEFEVVSLD